MNNKFLLLLFFLIPKIGSVFAQEDVSDYKWRVQFTDKNNTPYSLDNPSEYLSPKAIQRRLNQNIKIKENDLPVNPWYIDSVINTGVSLLNKSKWLNYITITNVDSISLSEIKALPFVSKVETIYKFPVSNFMLQVHKNLDYSIQSSVISNQSLKTDNSKLKTDNTKKYESNFYEYGYSFAQDDMVECDSLHNKGFRGQGMTIALMDAGFYNVDVLGIFDSLRINNRIEGTKDFVNINGNVYEQSTHGMMVLSIMAGNMPNIYIGTAPEANYWLFRTEDVNSEYIIEEDNWVSAAEYADSVGVDVINSSLGYSTFDDSTENLSVKDLNGKTARISIAATLAASKGIVVVSSAGNEGTNTLWDYLITAPADADSILSVGAVDINEEYADFSSRGPTSDGRLKPDVAALGSGTAIESTTGDIETGNGTSFSSPIIAGMAACLWQSEPEMSNMEIIAAIQKSCNHYSTPDIYTGYGIPNAMKAHSILSTPNSELPTNFVNSITVAPNPFSNEINITLVQSDNSDITIEIFDIAGRIQTSKILETFEVYNGNRFVSLNNLSYLSQGIYFLKVITTEKIYVKKLMKF